MKKPLVSVLMPAYNAEKYIGEAIESILNQTYKNFEFIIVDDASTDSTWKIIQNYAKKDGRLIALKNKTNLKICKTLNKGIKVAIGKYIARMDADDWSYPDRLEKQIKYMQKNPSLVISGGAMLICDEVMKPFAMRTYASNNQILRRKIMRYSPFAHPSVIFKTDIARKVGGYHMLYAEDIELYLNLGQFGNFGNLSDVLIKYREIPTSMTNTKLKITELHTLQLRLKAYLKLRYNASIVDFIYNFFHLISIYIIPTRLKIFIFNRIRNIDL